MIDVEKVIKGLERFKADFKPFCGNGSDWTRVDDAINLLKEQDAVEPKVSSTEQRCGNCNKVIEMDGWIACPWCGKPIAWNEWWNKNGEQEVK